ncbi:MAG: hypothetical protein EBE86_015170 [Hormoscilla sp. GUM202]|nr:hypothetical protein [Hormoscilla sp. GUM202]
MRFGSELLTGLLSRAIASVARSISTDSETPNPRAQPTGVLVEKFTNCQTPRTPTKS